MFSVERMPETLSYKTLSTLPDSTQDSNNNMIGSSTACDTKSTKKHTLAGKFLDNDTLLVILNTVLKTEQRNVTTKPSRQRQSHTQSQSVRHSTTSTCVHHDGITSTSMKSLSDMHSSQSHTDPRQPRQPHVAEIDCKIEQAMDSVKMELLLTVRKEVKQLKSQVAQLQSHNQYLEQENKILRSAAAPETLARLNSRNSTSQPPIASCGSS